MDDAEKLDRLLAILEALAKRMEAIEEKLMEVTGG